MNNTFVREYEKNNEDVLTIHQLEVGDVGCVVWDAALVLSKYLETKDFDEGEKLRSKCVLELGAGTGIVGIVAASFGAEVTITDLPDFVPLMQLNMETNKEKLQSGKINARSLTWGEESIDKEFDYIFVADCIYYEKSLEPLVAATASHCLEKTEVYCCFERRLTGNKPELERKFFDLIKEKFLIEEIPLENMDEHFRSDDIHIMKFVKKKTGS